MTNANQKETGSCLDGATLASFIDGTLDDIARVEAEEHLGDCQECLGQLTSLQLLLSSIEEKPDQAPEWVKVKAKNLRNAGFEKKPATRKSWSERLSALLTPVPMRFAAVGIAASLAFFAFYAAQNGSRQVTPFSDTVRSGVEEQEGLLLNQPDGGMVVSRDDGAEFAWHGAEGADRYIVRIYGEDGTVAWKGESTQPRLTLTGDGAGQLLPGTNYEWSVEAVFPFSESIRSSLQPVIVR